jgi:OmpA-OmpF porin, OOP family
MQKIFSRTALVLLMPFAVSFSASAADVFKPGPYVGGGLGVSNFSTSGSSLVKTKRDERDTAAKLYGGYQLNENLGVELGYSRLGKLNDTFTVAGQPVVQNLRGESIYAAATGRLPLDQNFALTGKLGVSFGKVKGSNGLPAGEDLTGSKRGILVGIGAEYKLTPSLALTADYERYGKLSQRVSANALTAGIKYNF